MNEPSNTERSEEVRLLGEWDWWTLPRGNTLHAATVEYDENYDPSGYGITACMRRGWLSIPGIFSRTGLSRCRRCCNRLGYPQGVGSPKNDEACRPLVERRIKEGA